MNTISVNAYITANFPKRDQQRIRLAIKSTFRRTKLVDSIGNPLTGYRDIFLSHVAPDMPRSKFLAAQFSFRATGDGLYWLNYKRELEKQEADNSHV